MHSPDEDLDSLQGDKTQPEANLGYATTEELMRELISRFRMTQYSNQASCVRHDVINAIDRALILAEMIGEMKKAELEYKTYNKY